jgi:putative serine protease PepD
MSERNPNPRQSDNGRVHPGPEQTGAGYDDTQRLQQENTHRFGSSEHGYTQNTGGQYQYGRPGPYPQYGQGQYGQGQQGQGPYGHAPYGGYGGYGYYGQQTGQPPADPKQNRHGTAVTAGIVVASLVVGGLAGLAGAAGLAASGAFASISPSPPASSSAIVKQPDTPAVKGSVEQVAKSVLPSVVKINVQGPAGAGSGSGIIISSDGEILTNNHVVELARGGGLMWVNLNDGSTAKATVVGTDPVTDLAVIKAQGVSGLTPATLNDSSNLQVGEQVVAIGSPFGLQATVTSGIISALDRPVSVSGEGGNETTYPAIQTDAAINPGNSGGPLVNMNGEVVGINSSIRTASSGVMGGEGGSIGLGFAIPINKVLPIVQQLKNGETPTHARLGVSVSDASSQNGMYTGAGIARVTPGSAADQAGLQRGEVITKVGDEDISGAASLVATIRGHRPGDKVTLTVVRDGDTNEVTVTLGSDKGNPLS